MSFKPKFFNSVSTVKSENLANKAIEIIDCTVIAKKKKYTNILLMCISCYQVHMNKYFYIETLYYISKIIY